MKKSRLLGAVCACVLTLIASTSQAVSLQNGDVLVFTTIGHTAGSSVSGTSAAFGIFDGASLDALNGIIIGASQPTFPDIDATWTSTLAGAMGNHTTTSNVDVIDGSTLDFSGWTLNIFGENYNFGATQSFANYTYDGTNFTLDYSWAGAPLGSLGVIDYFLHLEGTVVTSPVPVPAAVWLFGSGLLGLVGMARRKKTA